MLTPVTGFRRLLEPSLQSIPSSDVLVVAVGHRRVRSSGPISCLRRAPCGRVKDLPQSLGSPSPPTCLESSGVRPRTSDTVIRPCGSRPSRASQPSSPISSLKPFDWSWRGIPAHRFRRLSADPGRQDFSLPGTGFLRARHLSRRCVLRRLAGQAPSIRSSDVCFSNSRLRLPVLAGFRHCPRNLRLARSDGLWDPPR